MVNVNRLWQYQNDRFCLMTVRSIKTDNEAVGEPRRAKRLVSSTLLLNAVNT
jgi:hypothetical protein